MRTSTARWVGAALLMSLAAGCAANTDEGELDAVGQSDDDVRSVRGDHYFRMRRDFRRCVSPLCGGAWVREVNRSTTRCADGTYAAECYVADADFTALGLDESAQSEFANVAEGGGAVVRGRMRLHDYGSWTLGQFVVTEGWRAATEAEPTGSFYTAHDNGIRCVRAPCFHIDRARLNSTLTGTLSDLTLDRVDGVSDAQVTAGFAALSSDDGVVVAGTIRATSGGGRGIVASQFYTRVGRSVAAEHYCDTDADCTVTVYRAAPENRSECYCRICPTTVLNVTTADANERAFDRVCSSVSLRCPVPRCIRPLPVSCVAHACTQ